MTFSNNKNDEKNRSHLPTDRPHTYTHLCAWHPYFCCCYDYLVIVGGMGVFTERSLAFVGRIAQLLRHRGILMA